MFGKLPLKENEMKRWIIIIFVSCVIAVGIWQSIDHRMQEERLRSQLTPTRTFFPNCGGMVDWSESRGIYVIYDCTLEEKLEDGSIRVPTNAGLIPALTRLDVPRLRVGERFYDVPDNTVCWLTTHRGMAQVTIQPFEPVRLLEDFIAYLETSYQLQGATNAMTQRGVADTKAPETDDWLCAIPVGSNGAMIAYFTEYGSCIVYDGSFDRGLATIVPAETPSTMPTLRVGGKSLALERNVIYWLTKPGDAIQVETKPFEMGCLLRNLDWQIAHPESRGYLFQ